MLPQDPQSPGAADSDVNLSSPLVPDVGIPSPLLLWHHFGGLPQVPKCLGLALMLGGREEQESCPAIPPEHLCHSALLDITAVCFQGLLFSPNLPLSYPIASVR